MDKSTFTSVTSLVYCFLATHAFATKFFILINWTNNTQWYPVISDTIVVKLLYGAINTPQYIKIPVKLPALYRMILKIASVKCRIMLGYFVKDLNRAIIIMQKSSRSFSRAVALHLSWDTCKDRLISQYQIFLLSLLSGWLTVAVAAAVATVTFTIPETVA